MILCVAEYFCKNNCRNLRAKTHLKTIKKIIPEGTKGGVIGEPSWNLWFHRGSPRR